MGGRGIFWSVVVVIGLAPRVNGAQRPRREAADAPPAAGFTQLLGRPTDHAITLSLLSGRRIDSYVEFGISAQALTRRTPSQTLTAGVPLEVELRDLDPATRYFYRVRTHDGATGDFAAGELDSFVTARRSGSSFSFALQGDSHPERAGTMYSADLYRRTMTRVAAEHPDLYFTLGDDFSIERLISSQQLSQPAVDRVYADQREFLGQIGRGTPLFLVNGNHEEAARFLLDGTPTSAPVLAARARNAMYPLPAPGGFYTGDEEQVEHVGLLRDYYAFTWGDALFVAIDPYWHSQVMVDAPPGGGGGGRGGRGRGGGGGGRGRGGNATRDALAGRGGPGDPTRDRWAVTLGDAQYAWLKRTLEGSTAKYKFVFAHHVMGTGRGAVEEADLFEWGGRDRNGADRFKEKRPTWELPIHQLFVKTGVTIFFQGHDHLFARQEKDGVIYQETPNPADDSYQAFNREAYRSGDVLPNAGHLRVNVTPDSVRVEYVRSFLSKDESPTQQDGAVAFAYTVRPRRAVPAPARSAPPSADQHGALQLRSRSAQGSVLPVRYTCDGVGLSPALSWSGAPAGTVAYAMLMTTQPPTGGPKFNWLLYDIPATTTTIPEGSTAVGTFGFADDGAGRGYAPPCSKGPGPKQYTFTLHALSARPALGDPSQVRVTGSVLAESIAARTIATATLTLTATRDAAMTNCGYIVRSLEFYRAENALDVSCEGGVAAISSDGIQSRHPMMNGITATNQQVPIPQDFTGANAWHFPLTPTVAATKVAAVDGPIGIAVNGVPIFNPCKQGGCDPVTGRGDTKVEGELDLCNGHAGRADDYHYHAAPLCMMRDQAADYWDTHPLGWALDGYAIFGFNGPNGRPAARDAMCGGNTDAHPNAPAGYAYHVTEKSPYVLNCFYGDPSPDLARQGSKYAPIRPPGRPMRMSDMTLDATAASLAVGGTTTMHWKVRSTTYQVRYTRTSERCWTFTFLTDEVTTGSSNYCRRT